MNRDENYDNLELEPLLREGLQAKNAVKGKPQDDAWVSVNVNADEMPGAVLPSGSYVVAGDSVRLTMSLIRDGKKIDSFQVEGSKADKEALVRLVLDGIARAMKKLELELAEPAP